MIGWTISSYRITAKLGQVGMGVVYRAEDTRLKRPVAIKGLPPSSSQRSRVVRIPRAHLGHNTQAHRTLGAMVKQTDQLAALRKNDLRFGDRVVVTTGNSTYSIHVLKNGQYAIPGGWVDQEGLSPLRTHISGCTWGGSTIQVDIVAAGGLHLEFGNRVVTSRIRRFNVVRSRNQSAKPGCGPRRPPSYPKIQPSCNP